MLSCLTPPGMGNVRVDVGVKPIFVWRLDVPCRRRLLRDQAYLHNRLNTLESVLPGHHQPDGSAVWRRQSLPVKACREDCEGMHSLIQPKPLNVRPVQYPGSLIGHPLRIEKRLEGHV